MSVVSEYKELEEPIFELDAPPKDSLNEATIEFCIYNDLNPKEEKTKLEEEWDMRMTCTQEWFIRCSSINKFLFLELLCKSTSGVIVLENVLKSVDSIFSKDVLESLSQNSTNFAYDKIPTDDNRTLDEEELNKAMKEGFVWFINMDYSSQTRVILRLLRIAGGGLVFMIYKLAEKILTERQVTFDRLSFLTKGESYERKRLSSRVEEQSLAKDTTSETSDSLRESILRKQNQLERRRMELLNYKKLRGLLDEDEESPKDTETVDYLQILPISLNRRIMSYIDDKTLSGFKKVGRYWSKMIDESINEKSGRKAINAKINKIIGIKADKEEKKKEENDEEEELELITELGAKDLINAKNENERALIALQERYKAIVSRKCSIKTLDTSYFPERCGAFSREADIIACSTPSNFVYFYSLRTGARFNFVLFGLESSITCLSLHENKIHVFIGCRDGSVISKDFRTNQTTATFKGHTDEVLSIITTPSNFLSASKDNTVKYFQLWTGVCLLCINLNSELHISSVLLRNDKPHMTAIGTEEGVLALANICTKKLLSKVKLHSDGIRLLDHDKQFLITGSASGKIRIWNMNRMEEYAVKLQPYYDIKLESPVRSLKFHQNQIFCGCGNGTIQIISLATGKISKSLNVSTATPITGLDVTQDKTLMKLVIWQEAGVEIRTFPLEKPSTKTLKEKGVSKIKQRKPRSSVRPELSETVTHDYIRNFRSTLDAVPGVKMRTTYEGTKMLLKDRYCTISSLRNQNPKNCQFKTDVFAEIYNTNTSQNSSFLLCTFPRNFNLNPQ